MLSLTLLAFLVAAIAVLFGFIGGWIEGLLARSREERDEWDFPSPPPYA